MGKRVILKLMVGVRDWKDVYLLTDAATCTRCRQYNNSTYWYNIIPTYECLEKNAVIFVCSISSINNDSFRDQLDTGWRIRTGMHLPTCCLPLCCFTLNRSFYTRVLMF